ncbi:RNA polymerase sigma-I factor [Alkalibaculum sp. M08DMB]|uniref:RNA polymerase sigma factor SigI n=1 Tax=Alkalibaculum sporogenes TaxID=2655001 RepID=A0A6A7K653_9FIRM|nr:RNA polymerase sigma-I factor [Alkalibaculum sporogenes]MPW24900.1 RNA polymerase sigma-I factor [Alkalibaculum sporogenes]
MENLKLKEILLEIKNGNELERERLIRHYKPYILNVVGHICKRHLTWSNDETSIGLIAFNRAINTFEFDKGRTFVNYVYLLIQRDIIDYFRKEKRHLHLVSDNNLFDHDKAELKASLELYQQSTNTSELLEEILELDEKLSKFNISFEQLERHSPKHRKTRIKVMEMAFEFIQHSDLVDELVGKKVFPVSSFTKRTGARPKSIERHRKYLITIIIIQLHPEWRRLSAFVQAGPGSVKI